jgi:hypothetical protein
MKRWVRIGLSVVVLVAAGPVLPALAFPDPSAVASWRVLYRPTAPTGYLTSVVATSSTGAWAGGTVTGSTGETRNWLLVHRIGRTWKRVRPPEVEAPGRATVAASGPKNVWVFNGWIQRWDGRRWHEMLSPLIGQFTPENSPVVLSQSDVWMYGLSFDHRLGSDYCLTRLEHWNGHRWAAISIKHFCATALAGSSARNVWLVGQEAPTPDRGRIGAYRFGGRAWRAVRMPHPYSYTGNYTLPTVTVAPSGLAWIGIQSAIPGPGTDYASALLWNGKRWHTTPPSPLAAPYFITSDGRAGLWMGPGAHWTGRTWIDTTPPASFNGGLRYSFAALARVPGTATILAAGGSDPGVPFIAASSPGG